MGKVFGTRLWWAPLWLTLLAGCTLTPGSGQLKLELKLPPKAAAIAKGQRKRIGIPAHPARGPEIGQMTCYGIIVKNAPNPVATGEVGGRVPACLQVDGAFFGPYSYESMLSGVSITLPSGGYSMQLLGIDGLSSCSETLSQIFSGGTTPQLYEVAKSAPFSFPESTSVTLDGTKYSAATATDLVPSCPPQTAPCQGYELCDTFDAANETFVGSPRTMNTGQAWAYTSALLSGWIIDNAVSFSPIVPNDTPSFLMTDPGVRDVEVVAEINPGSRTGNNAYRLIARHTSASDYAFAELSIDNGGVCGGGVYLRSAGANSTIDSGSVNCAELTSADGYVAIKLTVIGNTIGMRIGEGAAYTYFGGTGVTALVGTQVGLSARGTGTLLTDQTARIFKARIR